MSGSGFRVEGLGLLGGICRRRLDVLQEEVSGFRVWGLGFRVSVYLVRYVAGG